MLKTPKTLAWNERAGQYAITLRFAPSKGTPFAPEKQPNTWGYRRQTAREFFVEQKVRKRRILVDGAEA